MARLYRFSTARAEPSKVRFFFAGQIMARAGPSAT